MTIAVTEEGQQAYDVLDWAGEDPQARAQAAYGTVRSMGQQLLGDPASKAALGEVGDVLRVLGRMVPQAQPVTLSNGGGIAAQIELAFNPMQARDSHGKWTKFGGVGEAVRVMGKEREGFSVSPRTGDSPTGGYMVALDGHTHRYPAEILDDPEKLHRAIDDMLMSEKESFKGKNMYLGGWVEDGKLWLDPSENVQDRQEAERLGRERDQVGIFDLNTFNTISTGGSGGGRIIDHANEGPRGGARELLGLAGGRAAGGGREARRRHQGGIAAQLELVAGGDGSSIDLGFRYNPLEKRNAHGEWTRDGSTVMKPLSGMKFGPGKGYEKPPADRIAGNKAKASDNPFIKKYHLSAENVVAAYDDANEDERDQGMRWYADAHTVARMIGGGDADKGAALLSCYSPQTDWQTNALNAAHAMEFGHSPEHGTGITGTVKAKANAILARDHGPYDDLFPRATAPKTNAFYKLIRNGGDTPDDQEGLVVMDRHALSVAAGRRLTKDQTDAPTYKDIKAEHPDWTDEQAKEYKASMPPAPVGSVYTYEYLADMYRNAALAISKRDGIDIAPHQVQAITWLRQQRKNNEMDAKLVAAGNELVKMGQAMAGAPGAKEAKGRASRAAKAWNTWEQYAIGHTVATHLGTTAIVHENPISTGIAGQIENEPGIARQIELGKFGSDAAFLERFHIKRGEHGKFASTGESLPQRTRASTESVLAEIRQSRRENHPLNAVRSASLSPQAKTSLSPRAYEIAAGRAVVAGRIKDTKEAVRNIARTSGVSPGSYRASSEGLQAATSDFSKGVKELAAGLNLDDEQNKKLTGLLDQQAKLNQALMEAVLASQTQASLGRQEIRRTERANRHETLRARTAEAKETLRAKTAEERLALNDKLTELGGERNSNLRLALGGVFGGLAGFLAFRYGVHAGGDVITGKDMWEVVAPMVAATVGAAGPALIDTVKKVITRSHVKKQLSATPVIQEHSADADHDRAIREVTAVVAREAMQVLGLNEIEAASFARLAMSAA